MQSLIGKAIKWSALAVAAVLMLYVIFMIFPQSPVMGSIALSFLVLVTFVYSSAKAYVYRYMFPGLAAVAIFVIMPLLYTFYLGFTNYGSKNLLPFERVTKDFMEQTYRLPNTPDYNVALIPEGAQYRLLFTEIPIEKASTTSAEDEMADLMGDAAAESGAASPDAGADKIDPDQAFAMDDFQTAKPVVDAPDPEVALKPTEDLPPLKQWLSEPLALKISNEKQKFEPKLQAVDTSALPNGFQNCFVPDTCDASVQSVFDEKQQTLQVQFKDALATIKASIPNQKAVLSKDMLGFTFAAYNNQYEQTSRGVLKDNQKGGTITADFKDGFYKTEQGVQVTPGFKVGIGLDNYTNIFSDSKFRGPFFGIFGWTALFSGLSVLFTLAIGCLLAVVLNWESLKGRALYRMMLFLPYAVPGFISILVFKGMFRQSGEINYAISHILHLPALNWMTDPFLAKTMLVLVNTWLGYPYMMILCMGLIKAIPSDLYEASAIAGAGPMTNFFKITAPLIIKPITPLLVASFAFNFNNFVLVSLLTNGRPDYLNTDNNAGQTDILVSYTYKLAFEGGQQFGLAAAISTIIFVLVVVMSLFNMRLTRSVSNEGGH